MVKEPRSNLVGVLLTKPERDALDKLSNETGATRSSILRMALRQYMMSFGVTMPSRHDQERENRPHGVI